MVVQLSHNQAVVAMSKLSATTEYSSKVSYERCTPKKKAGIVTTATLRSTHEIVL